MLIDDIPCVVQSGSFSATQIVCDSGTKNVATNPVEGKFEVIIGNNKAVTNKKAIYGNLYSDENTWGGDIPPREGDSIVVPKGETLIIDASTPKLYVVIVEGTLTFLDGVDLTMDATYIVIREGKFTAGTWEEPRNSKLTITLHGTFQDRQLPEMGNKVIGCHQCTLDIHGTPRTPTWTLMSETAEAGATSILVDDAVDWQVGEEIIIASSDWNHLQSERRFITSVTNGGRTINFKEPLINKHYSAIETYGAKQFPMQIEVGLLSRNIVI